MKSIVFDAGPVISLTMNNLLWLLEPMKKKFGGDFLLTEAVRRELVDIPLDIKRFEFEALQVLGEIDNKVFKVADDLRIVDLSKRIFDLANSSYSAKGTNLSILHNGECSTLACSIVLGSDAIVLDERTTREIIEDPELIAKHMQDRLHTKVSINFEALEELRELVRSIKVIRSVELVVIAYELGLLDKYISRNANPGSLRSRLLDSVLWGVKLGGCTVSEKEIRQIMRMVK